MLELRDRFFKIPNLKDILKVAAPQYQDPKAYYTDLIANEVDKNIAEKRLSVLEGLAVRDKEEQLKLDLERTIRLRDKLLRECDWTQLPDAPIQQLDKKVYRKYREYLRNLPEDIRSGRLDNEAFTFEQWNKWISSVKNLPGFDKYIP